MSQRTYTLGSNIRRSRQALGLTQTQFAQTLGVAQVTVSAWEVGAKTPTITRLVSIATVLETTVNDLLGSEDEVAA